MSLWWERARALARRPEPWLLLQAGLVFAWLVGSPDFATQEDVDTRTYTRVLRHDSWTERLSNKRTLGYPYLLAGIKAATGDLTYAAHVQVALYLLAVVGFGVGLERYLSASGRGSTALAVATASPLFYGKLLRDQATFLLSDLPGATAAVATVACLLWLLARPERKLAWACLGASLFATYQVRPSYLFLVPLVPLAAGAMLLLRDGWRSARAPRHWLVAGLGRPIAGLAMLAFLPLLAWCLLRWAVAGHFGLVSFGGLNLVGITGSMVSEETIPRLPERHRELARAMLAMRQQLGLEPLEPNYDFHRWRGDYNYNCGQVSMLPYRELYLDKSSSATDFRVDLNRDMTDLSWELIALRPDLYWRWIHDGTRWSLERLFDEPTVEGPLGFAGLALAAWLMRRPWRRQAPSRRLASLEIAVLALGFALASHLLVILVESPIDRYLFASALFLPSALVGLGWELGREAIGWSDHGRLGRRPVPTAVRQA